MKNLYEIYKGDAIDINESKAQQFYDNYIKNNKILDKLKEISADLLQKAGKVILIQCLKIYYIIVDSNVPLQEKMSAMACILYVISPIDAISDFLPAGYVDDVAMITFTLGFLKKYDTRDIQDKAESKYNEWFKK